WSLLTIIFKNCGRDMGLGCNPHHIEHGKLYYTAGPLRRISRGYLGPGPAGPPPFHDLQSVKSENRRKAASNAAIREMGGVARGGQAPAALLFALIKGHLHNLVWVLLAADIDLHGLPHGGCPAFLGRGLIHVGHRDWVAQGRRERARGDFSDRLGVLALASQDRVATAGCPAPLALQADEHPSRALLL